MALRRTILIDGLLITSGRSYVNKNLYGARLSSIDLSNTKFDNCDLSRATLSGSDLSKAGFGSCNLSGARFVRSNLEKASFSVANLESAILKDANCRGASFRDAKMHGVDISNADFTDANFSGVKSSQLKGVPYKLPSGVSIVNARFVIDPASIIEGADSANHRAGRVRLDDTSHLPLRDDGTQYPRTEPKWDF